MEVDGTVFGDRSVKYDRGEDEEEGEKAAKSAYWSWHDIE